MQAYQFYEQIAENYNLPIHQHFYQEVGGKLLEQIPDNLAVNNILEIGSGTGFTTSLLRQRFPKAEIIALEPSFSMLSKAKQKCSGVDFRCEPLSDFDGRRHFDMIVCSMVGHWLSSKEWQKLTDLNKKAILALTLPVINNNDAKKSLANQQLKRLLFKLKTSSAWLKQSRLQHPPLNPLPLREGRAVVSSYDLEINEKFKTRKELAETLYTRGVFLALFGTKAEIAKNLFLNSPLWGQSPTNNNGDSPPINFYWSFKLFASYPEV